VSYRVVASVDRSPDLRGCEPCARRAVAGGCCGRWSSACDRPTTPSR